VRMFADVPVGALLSAGVDSSLICWAIAKLGGNLTAYTVGTPGDPMDESQDAAATAQSLGIQHHMLNLSAEDIPGLQDLTTAYGEPFACASSLGMLQISHLVKPEATVLLTGDGGDDVFLGYPEHKYFWLAQRLADAIPSPLAKAWYGGRKLLTPIRALKRPMHLVDYATGGLGALAAAREGLPEYQQHRLLGERLRSLHLWQREIAWTPQSGRNVLTEMLDYDRKGRFVGEYMTKVDGGTMHYALEARSPFLDQDLWEFAATLPYGLRLQGGVLKAVLRELARRRLGERVSSGRKRGFGIPVQRWLPGRWYASVTETFQDSMLHREGWINGDAMMADLRAAKEKQYAPVRLWYLYVLESWLRYESQAGTTSSNAPAMLSA
jgi:asparagine synthase (glutamine-hydrolysing)